MNTLARLDSTQLVIVITVQNIGIQHEVESNFGPLFDLQFDPKYWPNIKYFLNNESRSSYLSKFENIIFLFEIIFISQFSIAQLFVTKYLAYQFFRHI